MYIVEGNIGVGKSTFLTLVKQNLPEIEIHVEPKDNWTNQIYGQSLLENFYKDPKRWAYTLETLAMICRSRDHIKEQNTNNQKTIMERSIYSGHYCFSINGYHSGYFTQIEWEIYNKWVDFLLNYKCQPPHGFIYLRAEPQICFERIKKRNRISEKKLTLAYVKQIDHWHEKFLIQKDGVYQNLKPVPVLILDCNQSFLENTQNMHNHLVKVQNFIEKTLNTPAIQNPTKTQKSNIF